MNRFVVVVFPTETGAQKGGHVLEELHRQGELSVYDMAVLVTSADGRRMQSAAKDKGIGAPVGSLVGGLIGLLVGPIGAAIGFASGGLIGFLRELINTGTSEAFLNDIHRKLTPGTSALVAEIVEEVTSLLDKRMEAIGGVVFRQPHIDSGDDQVEKEAAIRRAELAELRAEALHLGTEDKPRLQARIDAAQQSLSDTAARLDAKLDQIRRETEQKIRTLEEQENPLALEAKARVEERIAALRTDLTHRTAKLEQASQSAQEALRS